MLTKWISGHAISIVIWAYCGLVLIGNIGAWIDIIKKPKEKQDNEYMANNNKNSGNDD